MSRRLREPPSLRGSGKSGIFDRPRVLDYLVKAKSLALAGLPDLQQEPNVRLRWRSCPIGVARRTRITLRARRDLIPFALVPPGEGNFGLGPTIF